MCPVLCWHIIFRNRAGNRLRLLLWDGNGAWLCQRRLHQGRFVWPTLGDAVFSINQAHMCVVMG